MPPIKNGLASYKLTATSKQQLLASFEKLVPAEQRAQLKLYADHVTLGFDVSPLSAKILDQVTRNDLADCSSLLKDAVEARKSGAPFVPEMNTAQTVSIKVEGIVLDNPAQPTVIAAKVSIQGSSVRVGDNKTMHITLATGQDVQGKQIPPVKSNDLLQGLMGGVYRDMKEQNLTLSATFEFQPMQTSKKRELETGTHFSAFESVSYSEESFYTALNKLKEVVGDNLDFKSMQWYLCSADKQVKDAFLFAYHAHEGQTRKYNDVPYIVHPISVAMEAQKEGLSSSTQMVALLHDVLEDTKATYPHIASQFGKELADKVAQITDVAIQADGSRETRMLLNHLHLQFADKEIKELKIIDSRQNLLDIARQDPQFAISRYIAEKEQLAHCLTGANPVLLAEFVKTCHVAKQLAERQAQTTKVPFFADKTLIVPIAPSGAGKSTLGKQIQEANPQLLIFSYDAIRLSDYGTATNNPKQDYAVAMQKAESDPAFFSKAKAQFIKMLETGKPIYSDNTNFFKRRQGLLDLARKHGYTTVAVQFNGLSLQDLLSRQHTREDKQVPDSAVRTQWQAFKASQPRPGEFSKIISHAAGTERTKASPEKER